MSVCSAAMKDWVGYDRHLASARMLLRDSGFVDLDNARHAGIAGDIAHRRRHAKRARRAWRLAARQYRGLGREVEAQVVETKIEQSR